MHLIFERLKGATFQAELLVMTVLGLVNCALNWTSFNWSSQAERINNVPIISKYSEEIKNVLQWVVIARMSIDGLIYFASYLGNLYSVFTWCRPNLLLPWMVISALKNFLLQLILFIVVLMLYLEKNFPTPLFLEFIVESAIKFGISAYYWWSIKKSFVEMRRIQRNKLTRVSKTEHSNSNSAISNNFIDKKRKFMNLTNSGDLSSHLGFEFDGDRQFNRLTKSLTTLLSMESHVSVDPKDNSIISIIKDDLAHSPAEKSMRILGLDQNDINEIRFRSGKKIANDTKIQSTDLPLNTQRLIDKMPNIRGISLDKNPEDNQELNTKVEKIINVAEEDLTENVQNVNSGNPRKRCYCIKSNDLPPADKNNVKKRDSKNAFPEEGHTSGYEDDNEDSSVNRNSRKSLITPIIEPLKKNVYEEAKSFGKSIFWSIDFPLTSEKVSELSEPRNSKNYSKNLNRPKEQQKNSNDIESLENDIQSTVNDISFDKIKENEKKFITFEKFPKTEIHVNFHEQPQNWKNDSTEVEAHSSISRPSTLTDLHVTDSSKKSLIKPEKMSTVVTDQLFSSLVSRETRDLQKNLRRKFLPGLTLLAKLRRPEKVQDREARELSALRAYNRLTLLEDRREMEMKKWNSAYNRRTRLSSRIPEVSKNETKQQVISIVNNLHEKLDQPLKRQTRSKISNLGNFNLDLDDLENSISMSFSGEKRKLSKLNNQMITSNDVKIDGRKQFSKYSKPMKVFDATNFSSVGKIEGVRIGRDLQRTPGLENITFRENIEEKILEPSSSSPMESRVDQTQKYLPGMLYNFESKHGIHNLIGAFENIDWTFNGDDIHEKEDSSCSQEEFVLYDIIDDTNVITLLQTAFASNAEDTERGFSITPGSTEIYSFGNYLEEVLQQIMKTTKLRSNTDGYTVEVTTGVDYGENYFKEMEITGFSMSQNSEEETLIETDTVEVENQDEKIDKNEEVIGRVPKTVELSWSSYSREGIVTDDRYPVDNEEYSTKPIENSIPSSYLDPSDLKYSNAHNIVKLLSEKEINKLECWTKELKDLTLNGERRDFELSNEFRNLTNLPGYCVVKMLVDFFRHFVAVSRSTMTSRIVFPRTSRESSSVESEEEFVSGYLNEISNTSAAIQSPILENNLGSTDIADTDIHNSDEASTDQSMENRRNDRVFGVQGDRSIFPLGEDQFYFGPPNNIRHQDRNIFKPVNETISSLDEKVTTLGENNLNITTQQIDACVTKKSSSNPPVHFDLFEATPRKDKNPEIPFKTNSAVDSFDSLYSIDYAGMSKPSESITSIGAECSFEEFPKDPSIPAPVSIESRNPEL